MIPTFPEFTDISINNKEEMESYTNKFKPYSDLNFVSLYAWDTEKLRKCARLDDGLAVLMTDYDTNEPLLSFLGELKNDTIFNLIKYAKAHNIKEELFFIGEECIKGLQNNEIVLEEDPPNFDYIISVSNVAELFGREYSSKRHLANGFERENENVRFYSNKLTENLFNENVLPLLNNNEDTHENEAIERLCKNLEYDNLILSTVSVGNKLAGFSIDEVLTNRYAISHFFKADYNFRGISEFMNREVAKKLKSLGSEYWNWEQDLGLKSLQNMKSGYRPTKFLKKYKVSLS